MKITALKNLATSKWRTLGEGHEMEVTQFPGQPFYHITFGTPEETFGIQLNEAEARRLLAALSTKLPRLGRSLRMTG